MPVNSCVVVPSYDERSTWLWFSRYPDRQYVVGRIRFAGSAKSFDIYFVAIAMFTYSEITSVSWLGSSLPQFYFSANHSSAAFGSSASDPRCTVGSGSDSRNCGP
jgi:hypothetical protein